MSKLYPIMKGHIKNFHAIAVSLEGCNENSHIKVSILFRKLLHDKMDYLVTLKSAQKSTPCMICYGDDLGLSYFIS